MPEHECFPFLRFERISSKLDCFPPPTDSRRFPARANAIFGLIPTKKLVIILQLTVAFCHYMMHNYDRIF